MASKMRLSSGIDQWASSSSLVGTFSTSYGLYAMATQRKLAAAISSIAFLKNAICQPRELHSEELLRYCQKESVRTHPNSLDTIKFDFQSGRN